MTSLERPRKVEKSFSRGSCGNTSAKIQIRRSRLSFKVGLPTAEANSE
jgi:hypothetical protein